MEASIKYVDEHQHKRSIHSDVSLLKQLQPWIGSLPLPQVHNGTLEPWVRYKQGQGRAAGTINHGLKVVRHILRLAESEWMYDNGLTWLHRAPRIKLLPDRNKKPPYPLSWEEQRRLFS